MNTLPEMMAERFRKQAAGAGVSPTRLLLEEMVDNHRNYMLVLDLFLEES